MKKTILTPAELVELTGLRRYEAQARALRRIGVEPLRRPDGSNSVTWLAIGLAQAKVGLASSEFVK